MALGVIDRAMQSFGAEGVSQDQHLAETWAGIRTLRIADVWFTPPQIWHVSDDSVRARMLFTFNRLVNGNLSEHRHWQKRQLR